MINPIVNHPVSAIERVLQRHPLTVLFTLIVLNTMIVYAYLKKATYPDALYRKSLNLPPDEAIPLLEKASKFHHLKAKILLASLYIQHKPFCEAHALLKSFGGFVVDRLPPPLLLQMAKRALAEHQIDTFIEYAGKGHKAGSNEAAWLLAELIAMKRYEDALLKEQVIKSLAHLSKSNPRCYLFLHKLFLNHEEKEQALKALVAGSEKNDLECMKALYPFLSDRKDKERLLQRIVLQEPSVA